MKRFLVTACAGAALVGVATFKQPVQIPEGPAYQRLPRVPYESHPNRHFLTKMPVKVGIIGGGSAGLTTAKELHQQGFDVEILEKGSRVGGVWADNYDGAGLQGAYPHYNMPDHEFPPGTPSMPRLDQVQAFIDAYAEKFNLLPVVSLNSEVVNVAQNQDGEWTVTLKGGVSKKYDFLVLCAGMFSKPYIPSIPGAASFNGKIIHSYNFRNVEELCSGKKIVVVGAGKSALDVMGMSFEYAQSVTGLIRKHVWSVPMERKILGYPIRTLFKSRLSEFLAPSPEEPKTWLMQLLQPFAEMYWQMVNSKIREGLPREMVPDSDMRIQRCNMVITRDSALFKKIEQGSIRIITGEIEHIVPEGVVLQGETIPADLIVFATGFEMSTFGITDGDLWLYRGMLLPRVKNFAAIGYGAMVYSQLKNSLQAAWLAEVLRGKVALPSQEAMQESVDTRKEALQKAYYQFPKTAPHAWLEMTYFDMLLKDMGLSPFRKRSLLAEVLEAPDPLEYKSVITHRV